MRERRSRKSTKKLTVSGLKLVRVCCRAIVTQLGSKRNQIGILEQKSTLLEAKKRWKRCRVADFSNCGNQEILVLTDKGVISRWKFSKLEIAECISRLNLALLQGEKTVYLSVDREYNFAMVDTIFKCSSSKKISTRSFIIDLQNEQTSQNVNNLPSTK